MRDMAVLLQWVLHSFLALSVQVTKALTISHVCFGQLPLSHSRACFLEERWTTGQTRCHIAPHTHHRRPFYLIFTLRRISKPSGLRRPGAAEGGLPPPSSEGVSRARIVEVDAISCLGALQAATGLGRTAHTLASPPSPPPNTESVTR